MFFPNWDILIVDDEPDVLSITKLALRGVKVFGLPVKIHTARSKEEAIKVLESMKIAGAPQTMVSVALVDVVMETDKAGLELCEYIRNDLKNKTMQLYIRTGQPGVAPERKVIDVYDISGYFTKIEATEPKLYTLVKSGIRQWFSLWYANGLLEATNLAVMKSRTKKEMFALLKFEETGFEDEGGSAFTGFILEGKTISDRPAQAKALAEELKHMQPAYSTPEGHALIVDGTRHMVKVNATSETAEYGYVANTTMELPRALYEMTFQNGLILAMLYKRAVGAKPLKPVKRATGKVVKKAVRKPA